MLPLRPVSPTAEKTEKLLLASLPSKYKELIKVGEGTYAQSVLKAFDDELQEWVALKILDTSTNIQERYVKEEIEMLRKLEKVKNVMNLMEVITLEEIKKIILVFQYMDYDLSGLMSLPQFQLPVDQMKYFMYQILSGLAALSDVGVMHRDMKAANILINKDGVIKIGDLGTATWFNVRAKYHAEVCTLWYRPPELLLGSTNYGPEIDIWATACIFVELVTHKNFLRGHDEITQLETICKFFGTPITEPCLQGLPCSDRLKNIQVYPSKCHSYLQNYFDADGQDLMLRMFSYIPTERPSAKECLTHSFFTKENSLSVLKVSLTYPETHGFEVISKFQKEQKKLTDKPKPDAILEGMKDGNRDSQKLYERNNYHRTDRDRDYRSHPFRGRNRGRNRRNFWGKRPDTSPSSNDEIEESPPRKRYHYTHSPQKSSPLDIQRPARTAVMQPYTDPLNFSHFRLNPQSTASIFKPFFHDAHLLLIQKQENNTNNTEKEINPYNLPPKKLHTDNKIIKHTTIPVSDTQLLEELSENMPEVSDAAKSHDEADRLAAASLMML